MKETPIQPVTTPEALRWFHPQKNRAYLVCWVDDNEKQVVSGKQLEALLHSYKKWHNLGEMTEPQFVILGYASKTDIEHTLSTLPAAQLPRDTAICAKLLGVAI